MAEETGRQDSVKDLVDLPATFRSPLFEAPRRRGDPDTNRGLPVTPFLFLLLRARTGKALLLVAKAVRGSRRPGST